MYRMHLGRKKSKDAKKEENGEASTADETGGGALDSSSPSGSGITSGSSPRIANGAHGEGMADSPKKSSWSFLHKSRKSGKNFPTEFLCPISKSLMAEPVIVASGISYERQCIQIWFQQGNRHCFKTGQILDHFNLTPNQNLLSTIQTWCGKHKISKPQIPTLEHATQLVESCTRTTFVSDGSDPSTPAIVVDSRPGFNSVEPRPGFGDEDEFPEPHSDSEGYMQRYDAQPSLDVSNGEIEPAERPAWSSTREQHEGPLWVKGERSTHSQMCATESRESSREFDRGTYSVEHGSSVNGRSRHGSGHANGNSSGEWPSSSRGQGHRYIHSASASVLRGDGPSYQPHRRQTPLNLQTEPNSYRTDRPNEAPRQEGGAIEVELVEKLYSSQPFEQEEAAAEIRRLTRNTKPGVDYRLALCTPELLAALLPLLQSRYVKVQVNAVAAIMNLSLATENKIKIARASVIPSLVDLLNGRSEAVEEHAAGALFSLALNDENKMAIGVLGAIPPLIKVMRSGPPGTQRDAAMALYHLSFAHINKSKLLKAGVVPILLQLVQEASPDLVCRALLVLSNLAGVQEGRSAIGEGQGVAVFVGLLNAGMDRSGAPGSDSDSSTRGGSNDWASVRENAAAALLQLANHNLRFKGQAVQAGAVAALAALQEHGTPRAKDKATTLLNILKETTNPLKSRHERPSYQRRATSRGGDLTTHSETYAPNPRPDSAQF